MRHERSPNTYRVPCTTQKLEEETKARLFREKYASTLQAKVKELEERIRQLTAPGVRQPRHRAVQVRGRGRGERWR